MFGPSFGGAWTATALVALALAGFFTPAPGAASAAPRVCGFAAFDPELPEYARAEGLIVVPINDYSAGDKEITGTVQITPAGGATRTYPLEPTDLRKASWGGFEGRILVPGPTSRNPATQIVITWIERRVIGPGYTSECSGSEAATIPIIPLGGKVGEPSVPRLEGRFRVNFRVVASGLPGVERSARGVWRLRPRCHYFGCSTRVRSTLGLRDTFVTSLVSDRYDYFTIRNFGPRGSCSGTVQNPFTGEVLRHWKIRRAFKATRETRLKITRETSSSRATAFAGKSVLHIEPILSAERRGCPDKYVVERIRGHLIRS